MENSDPKQKKCVLYCRVSTKEQADEGNSLVTQERSGNEWARKNGCTIVRTYIERGESAKTADRPELQEMLRFCSAAKKNGIQSVVVYKIDRLARNTDDYREIRLLLRRYNVEIKSITEYFEDTPAGRFMENIIANVAQFDNDVRTERCVGGMREAMREGRYVWCAPTGYSNVRVNGRATIAPNDMAPLVMEAFELIASGKYPVITAYYHLKNKGLTTNSGTVMSRSMFHYMLKNPIYKGRIEKFGESHVGTFTPIVSDMLFDQAQSVLKGRGHAVRKYHKENPEFPLRRFVVDSEGRKLTGSFSRGRSAVYPFYRFTPGGLNIRRDDFERSVADYMERFQFSFKNFDLLRERISRSHHKIFCSRVSAVEQFEARLSRLKGQESELVRKNLEGIINDDLLKRELERLDCAMHDVRDKLLSLRTGDADPNEALDHAKDYLLSPGEFWHGSEGELKVGLQRFQFPQGMLFDGESFRTTEVACIFKEKEALLSALSNDVHLTGPTSNQFLKEITKLAEILRQRKFNVGPHVSHST